MKTKGNTPYGHQWIDDEDIKEVGRVLKSDWITQGPKVKEFEDALCKYTGAKYAVCLNSATSALYLSCLIAGIHEKDEVITSPITFVASANSAVYCGGKPVFADIDKDTYNIDPQEVKKKITPKTKAVISVHFAGHPCNMEEIGRIAKENNLIFIEDAAHALGAEYKGEKIGSCRYSDMTVLSFHPVKQITTGEGGAILTNRKDFYEKLLLLRSHGITKDRRQFTNFNPSTDGDWYYEMQELGYNYRITDFQCALGISQLKKLDKFVKRRTEIANKYKELLKNNKHITFPAVRPDIQHAWHIFVIKIIDATKRKSVFQNLRDKGIGVQVHYIPVYYQPYYQKRFGYKKGLCPKAEEYYQSAITIPLYPKMTDTQIRYIARILNNIL